VETTEETPPITPIQPKKGKIVGIFYYKSIPDDYSREKVWPIFDKLKKELYK